MESIEESDNAEDPNEIVKIAHMNLPKEYPTIKAYKIDRLNALPACAINKKSRR